MLLLDLSLLERIARLEIPIEDLPVIRFRIFVCTTAFRCCMRKK